VNFDAFIAIDWSGAAGSYNGIAVATCQPGRGAPRLVPPAGTRWSRREIAEWLANRLSEGKRLLIGFDFAFGFPFEECGYLGGQAEGIRDIFGLWTLIEERCAAESDFGCRPFIEHPDLAHLFWKEGRRPDKWVERKRLAEHACAEATKTRPDTLYKLLHSKQVGKASITGMRVLHYLRTIKKDHVAIWPFETRRSSTRHSIIVEIYPTMFRKLAAGSIAKLRSRADLNRALANLDSRPITQTGHLTDHDTDALISAAGLRSIAHDPEMWKRPDAAARVRREGWIFGV
jgi:hypothetical protein